MYEFFSTSNSSVQQMPQPISKSMSSYSVGPFFFNEYFNSQVRIIIVHYNIVNKYSPSLPQSLKINLKDISLDISRNHFVLYFSLTFSQTCISHYGWGKLLNLVFTSQKPFTRQRLSLETLTHAPCESSPPGFYHHPLGKGK